MNQDENMKDGKYEEALERARQGLPIDKIFPELKESEDERIRKDLITFICQFAPEHLKVQYVAYLEKQKEQKPAEVNVKALLAADRLASAEMTGRLKERSEIMDNPEKYGLQQPAEWSDSVAKEMFIKALERAVEQTKKGYELTDCDKHSWWEDFKAYCGIAPAEWSEEDEKLLDAMIDMATNSLYEPLCPRGKMIALLKSIRPQPHWKPSEKQMEILQYLCEHSSHANPDVMPTLESLYHDLQKLL